MRHWLPVVAIGFLPACSSSGPYGYSRTYAALGAEADAADGAREYDPVMAERDKAAWRKNRTSLFGVVLKRVPGPSGLAYVTLSLRTLEVRNLCEALDEQTCRVTVSEHEFAIVHAQLKLAPSDDLGEKSLNRGSLVRVVGKLTDDVDRDDGGVVLRADYYRHWPRNFFVTTASRSGMQM